MTLTITPEIGVYGTDFVANGNLQCNNQPVGNADVVVAWLHRLGDFITTVEVTTDSNGNYTLTIDDLPATADFVAEWDGNTACPNGAESNEDVGRVRPGVIMNPDRSSAPNGTTVRFTGRTVPGHQGQKLFLMLFEGHRQQWAIVGQCTMGGSASQCTIPYRKQTSSFLLFRVAYPTQHADHDWNWSVPKRID